MGRVEKQKTVSCHETGLPPGQIRCSYFKIATAAEKKTTNFFRATFEDYIV